MSPELFILIGAATGVLGIILLVLGGDEKSAGHKFLSMLFIGVGLGVAGYGFMGAANRNAEIVKEGYEGIKPATVQRTTSPSSSTPGSVPVIKQQAEFYRALAGLKDLDTANDKASQDQLFLAGPSAIGELLQLIDKEDGPAARELMAGVLTRFGQDAIAPITETMLSTTSAKLKKHLPIALGSMGEIAVASLEQMISHESLDVQKMAVAGLALTDSEKAAGLLTEKLKTTDNPELQVAISLGMRKLRKTSTVEPLQAFLKTTKVQEVQSSVLETLGYLAEFSPEKILPLIRSYLTNNDAKIRASAANALGYAKDKQSAKDLRKTLTDGDENVRAASAFALGIMGAKEAVYDIQKQLEKENTPFVKRMMQQAITDLR